MYKKLSDKELREKLSEKEYRITQLNDTERHLTMSIGTFLSLEYMWI